MAHPLVLPSALRNDVGTLVAIISQLNALPACAPVNASMVTLRLATHDSGSGWFATPFLYDSFIHNSTPVYPGALRSLLEGFSPVGSAASPELDPYLRRLLHSASVGRAQDPGINGAHWDPYDTKVDGSVLC
jgi:hypothetical protein